jgi:hypothetical protein
MKKIIFLLLAALSLPLTLSAQNVEDDLYYVPSKKKAKTTVTEQREVYTPADADEVEEKAPVTSSQADNSMPVVVQDKKGRTRDVDVYNRRFTAKENTFEVKHDTVYIKEKEQPDPDGEWVNGFQGSQDDYEYAMRLVRFHSPRYAIRISSPLYWDVVYGVTSWDWNVYTDGMYAYAFPSFSNPIWWDWRYGSLGWTGKWNWNYPYFAWNGWAYGWNGWYGFGGWGYDWTAGMAPGYGWGHNHYWGGGGHYWGWGGGNGRYGGNYYTNRVSRGQDSRTSRPAYGTGNRVTSRPSTATNNNRGTYNRVNEGSTTTGGRRIVTGTDNSVGRVVGTRENGTTNTTGVRTTREYSRTGSARTDAASTRQSTYTRPSSTRTITTDQSSSSGRTYGTRSSGSSSSRSSGYTRSNSNPSYNRGSSSQTRNYNSNRSSSNRSFSSGSNYNRGSSNGSFSSGGRSGGGGGSSSSGGGGSSSDGGRSGGGGGRSRR